MYPSAMVDWPWITNERPLLRSLGPLQGGATLIFEVELLDIKNRKAPAADEL
jgi:hypothetical protein